MVVLVLVNALLCHSLLTLLLGAKLTLVTISPTIVTMKPHELRFRLGLGVTTHPGNTVLSPKTNPLW
jgi:hypothetical protein